MKNNPINIFESLISENIYDLRQQITKKILDSDYEDLLSIKVNSLTVMGLIEWLEKSTKKQTILEIDENNQVLRNIRNYLSYKGSFDSFRAQDLLDNGLPISLVASSLGVHKDQIDRAVERGQLNLDRWKFKRGSLSYVNYDEKFNLKIIQRMINQDSNYHRISVLTGISKEEIRDALDRGFLKKNGK